ncbi:MAG TPA: metallophosphoesterase [Gammaproteobacteria bacterium]|nr:metallophosphoesterase [Gammaproteobacteria bacterium]
MSVARTSRGRTPRGARGRRAAGAGPRTASALAALVAFFASSVLTAQTPPPSSAASSPARIVAVSDVHGAYDSFVAVLKAARLLDDKLAWSGGRAALVVVGDVLDRGSGSRRVLELLMRLEREASAAGGRAQLVLGNHEIMNLTGELDYVAGDDYAAYAADESAAERAAALARFRAARAGTVGDDDALAADFARRYPPGFFAQRAAFASGGRFGAWLTRQPVLLVLGDTAFVHGGLPAGIAGKSAADVNTEYSAALREYLATFDALVAAGVLHPEDAFGERPAIADRYLANPQRASAGVPASVRAAVDRLRELTASDVFGVSAVYWYRGTVSCSEPIERDRLARIFASLRATRVVVGHTPTPTARVLSRFDGMVLRVDTGMQQRGGRASALVLEGGSAKAVYAGEPAAAPIAPQPRLVGPRAGGYDDARLKEVLASAPISARAKGADGTTRLTLVADGGAIEALFEPVAGKRAPRAPDVAAFRLDELLGFDLAPVAVLRELDGDFGAVYLDASQLPDESARAAERAGADAWCPLADQLAASYVFDTLAGSEGRTAPELRYTPASWQLALTGNRRLFGTSTGVPSQFRSQPLEVSPRLRERLQALDAKSLAAALGDVLDARRIEAILARRDWLLASRPD